MILSCETDLEMHFVDWFVQAQLPADMKPVLAESRHNKVPISVRQVCNESIAESLSLYMYMWIASVLYVIGYRFCTGTTLPHDRVLLKVSRSPCYPQNCYN